MCNNITKLIKLMQEIDLKLSLLRSKGFFASWFNGPMVLHLFTEYNKQSEVWVEGKLLIVTNT